MYINLCCLKEKSYLKEAKRLGYKDALVLEVNNISDLYSLWVRISHLMQFRKVNLYRFLWGTGNTLKIHT